MKIDIVYINDTRLFPNTELYITNYYTCRNELPPVRGKSAHGGTAVLTQRTTYKPETLKIDIQTSSVRIVHNSLEVLISAIYGSPQATITIDDLDLLTKSTN